MSSQDTIFYEKVERLFINNSLTIVMGILNITDDSFYDGGKYTDEEKWLNQANLMIEEGADIIDIGAYSSRPGARIISEKEELNKLIPAIESVRKKNPDLLISADTFRASVAKAAVAAGANIINDISGGTMDSLLLETVAKLQVPYILMHMQGTPQTMQDNPDYEDVTKEVFQYFEKKLAALKKQGISKVIIDPGFGFGKTVEHNYLLLKNMEQLSILGKPILAGVSRKSMIHKLLKIKTKETINGTSILNTIALQNGAKILRVHNVKEAKEAAKIADYMKQLK